MRGSNYRFRYINTLTSWSLWYFLLFWDCIYMWLTHTNYTLCILPFLWNSCIILCFFPPWRGYVTLLLFTQFILLAWITDESTLVPRIWTHFSFLVITSSLTRTSAVGTFRWATPHTRCWAWSWFFAPRRQIATHELDIGTNRMILRTDFPITFGIPGSDQLMEEGLIIRYIRVGYHLTYIRYHSYLVDCAACILTKVQFKWNGRWNLSIREKWINFGGLVFLHIISYFKLFFQKWTLTPITSRNYIKQTTKQS